MKENKTEDLITMMFISGLLPIMVLAFITGSWALLFSMSVIMFVAWVLANV